MISKITTLLIIGALILSNDFHAVCGESFRKTNKPPPGRAMLPRFTDVSIASGIHEPNRSRTATWVDYDEDGCLDIYICNGYNLQNILYHNSGHDTFEDIIAESGLVDFYYSYSAGWIDFDNDGHLDLFLDNNQKDIFYHNTGDNHFIDISSRLNFREGNCAVWADYNRDGWLDVYIARADEDRKQMGSPTNLLYQNQRNGTFTEIAARAGIADEADCTFANWVDFDNDGELDLYVTNLHQQPNRFFQNQGDGMFVDVHDSTGLKEHDGGTFWADYNNDGWFDLFVSEGDRSLLYKNNGNSTFTDITLTAGLIFPANESSDANWVDFDNDGYLDLHIQTYTHIVDVKSQTILYRNQGDESFTDVAQQVGLSSGYDNFGSSWGDYENDGDPDLLLLNRGYNILYRNEGNENHWIKIRLTGSASNHDAIGARVRVISASLDQYRDVGIGNGYKSFTRQTLQFGVGHCQMIDSIIVRWPSGIVQDTTAIPVNTIIDFHEPSLPLFSDVSMSSGVGQDIAKSMAAAFIDYNNDEWLDIFIANHEHKSMLYRNNGRGRFANVSDSAGLAYSSYFSGIGFSDFNNDGYGDLFIANGCYSPNMIFMNIKDEKFIDMTKISDISGGPVYSNDVTMGDFDKNGYLDIYVGNEGPNALYFNFGDFIFQDATHRAGVGDSLNSRCTAADYDNDGDLDIYVANNRGGYDEYPIKDKWPNRLYRNNGDGTFTDVAREAGVDDEGNSKGCCFGDYDNDGDLDLYVGDDGGPNRLYRNNGDATFTDATDHAGVAGPIGTHAVVFADFDNDGYLDIYAAGGSYIPEQHDLCMNKDHPDVVYRNNGDGTFTNITAMAGVSFNTALTSGMAVGDYDHDGDLDVVLANSLHKGVHENRNVLLKNNGSKNHWLHVLLTGRNSNRSAIGARITAIAGDLRQVREVSGGIGCGSQNSLPVEFGLGEKQTVDQLIIRWPSDILQTIDHVTVDRLFAIEEPYQLGPVQLSSAHMRIARWIFFISSGSGLLILLLNFILIPLSKHLIAIRASRAKEQLEKFHPQRMREIPYIAVSIHLVKFRDEYLLTYAIQPLHASLETFRHQQDVQPFPIKLIKLQRLNQQMRELWESYSRYIAGGQEGMPKTIDLLQKIGDRIHRYLGLTGLLNELYSMKDIDNLHIHFMVNHPLISWYLAFHSEQRLFLCDVFATGITPQIPERIVNTDRKLRGSREYQGASAILFYGDWKGHQKELRQVKFEIEEIGRMLEANETHVYCIYQDCDLFAETIHQIYARGENLRLIHYSGHIEENTLELGENDFFTVQFLRQSYGLEFSTQPLVFLNGCRSGRIAETLEKRESLAIEVMDCGAAACIVTQFQVPELAAKNFAIRFYHHFIGERRSVGQALRSTRLDLTKPEFTCGMNPDYDITRYFYDLYGDPGIYFQSRD